MELMERPVRLGTVANPKECAGTHVHHVSQIMDKTEAGVGHALEEDRRCTAPLYRSSKDRTQSLSKSLKRPASVEAATDMRSTKLSLSSPAR